MHVFVCALGSAQARAAEQLLQLETLVEQAQEVDLHICRDTT